jgi:hypothetical protein
LWFHVHSASINPANSYGVRQITQKNEVILSPSGQNSPQELAKNAQNVFNDAFIKVISG